MGINRSLNQTALQRSVGAEVRRRRTQLGMGGASLARASGISPGMLSRIERGLISPSISSLEALARALDVPVGSLFSSFDKLSPAIFTRAGTLPAIGDRRGKSARCELLGVTGHGAHIVKLQAISISSSHEPYPELPKFGVLYLYVVTGSLTYSHGATAFAMLPGDALLFDAEIPHRIESVSAFPTKILVVNSISVHPSD